MITNTDQPKKSTFRRFFTELLLVVGLTFIFSLIGSTIHRHLAILFLYVPFAYLLFALNNYVLLEFVAKKKILFVEYFLIVLLSSAIIFIPFWMIIQGIHGRPSKKIIILGLICVLILIPFTYYYFFRLRSDRKTIASLRKDLGKTAAEYKLMQSQVNPHFLFNVMNSIYGIALQEDASRTADSIQRLSQMMRFLIFENQLDQIPLSKDLNYLKEYIAIQSLRTESVPSVKIEHNIVDSFDNLFIAPMLLIPFVENAFKHGISMVKPSWIKVNADVVDGQLKFSVYNSIHNIEGTDLERTKSGIGLDNVKSRLDLTYPDKYMLVMEQNQEEYFVFLTIELRDSPELIERDDD
ncbi:MULTISPECIES: sensor histidine kinase [Sphingobacterium]|jgi:sensor histidine kinase YesM|uniref:sensor histidine kinase n=1 Tax=Sphingobacterium TaxID=28453 RepID=UPI000C0C1086|nr:MULTISPECIES: histidine kinase [Sphingobacterium]VTQ05934.1 Inner membrane protein ypdA [Sphingobacterium daejeonense]